MLLRGERRSSGGDHRAAQKLASLPLLVRLALVHKPNRVGRPPWVPLPLSSAATARAIHEEEKVATSVKGVTVSRPCMAVHSAGIFHCETPLRHSPHTRRRHTLSRPATVLQPTTTLCLPCPGVLVEQGSSLVAKRRAGAFTTQLLHRHQCRRKVMRPMQVVVHRTRRSHTHRRTPTDIQATMRTTVRGGPWKLTSTKSAAVPLLGTAPCPPQYKNSAVTDMACRTAIRDSVRKLLASRGGPHHLRQRTHHPKQAYPRLAQRI